MSDTPPAAIAGPKEILIRCTTWAGPLVRSGNRALADRPVTIVNASAVPQTIRVAGVDPLRAAETGAELEAVLRLSDPRLDGDRLVNAGASVTFSLTGQAPVRPGAYETTARFLGGAGAAIGVPVKVAVSAAHLWGMTCLLLGLLVLGVVNALAGGGAVSIALRDALRQRDTIHAFLDAYPPPRSLAGDVAEMDRDYDLAIATLSASRRVAVADGRPGEAADPLKRAGARAAAIRTALVGRPRGAADLADLVQATQALKAAHEQVRATLGTGPPPRAPGLAGGLDGFLTQYRARMLLAPMAWAEAEAATALGRAELAAAAGEGDAVRANANAAQRWLERSAHALDVNLAGYRTALAEAGALGAADQALRAAVGRAGLPPEAAEAVLAHLDAASAAVAGEPWLEQFRAASKEVNAAKTELARAMAQSAQAAFRADVERANAATDTGDVDALVAQLQAAPDHSDAAKRAGLGQVLALWRTHVASVPDETTRAALAARLDELDGIVRQGELTGLSAPYRALLDGWTQWNARLVQEASARSLQPLCLASFADLEREQARIEAILREQPADVANSGWEHRLAQLRFDMQRLGPDRESPSPDCLSRVLALQEKASALTGDMLRASIADADMPEEARRRMMLAAGFEAMPPVRPLDLAITTPGPDRVAGRPVTFALGGLDPVWAGSVGVVVDFGDGSPPSLTDAAALEHGFVVAHAYETPLTAHASVRATDRNGVLLGEGRATVLVAPSPAGAAQRLADIFLNLRFGIALLVASAVYYWRFANRVEVFGGRSFDYVEAFAVGFAANAAVAELPSVIAKIVAP